MAAASVLKAGPAHASGLRRTIQHPERSDPGTSVLALQRLAGNAALASMLSPESTAPRAAQRLVRGGAITEPVRPPPIDAAAHPGLRAVRASVMSAASRAAKHPSPKVAVGAAARAVEPASDEAEAQAKANRAGTIGNAPTPSFDRTAFIAAVNEAIAKQTPKTLEDAADFAKSGKAESVGAEVRGRVTQSKAASTGPLTEATAQPPDMSGAKITPGTPLPAPPPAPAPALAAGRAAPVPAPEEQTNLDHGPAQLDNQMSEAGVTDAQLRDANEPEFTGALGAKGEVAQHAATAPAALREREAGVIAGAQQDAAATGAGGAAAFASGRAAGLSRLFGGQQQAKGAAEGRHAAVNADLRAIFDKTKTDVEAILSSIETTVETDFTAGEAAARAAFKRFHEKEMDAFKEREYGWNPLAWAADLIVGPPPGAKAVFEASRKFYQDEMTKVISSIADTVGRKLTEAKTRVATGKQQIAAHVQSLDPALRAEGAKAAQGFAAQFDQLEQSVDEKSQSVVEDLAGKYVAAKGEVDAEITKMQEESKGLVGRAVAAVAGVITTVKNLAAMLTQVLARAAAAVEKIITDPIGFLGNFVNAVKGGIQQFQEHAETHVKAGLQAWLFGAVADAGIELPEKFDLKGVLQLVLSILGLTKEKILARIAAKLPPGLIDKVIQGFGVVKTIVSSGVAGIWQMLVEKIGDIKEMVMSQVQEMVSVEIIKAGVVWLISMLNPASAFVKACKMIYDVVMFFVEKAAQIKEFVDSILDSVESIAAGGVGAVAGYIEKTLARMVPILIGFLASLIGLGGISGKIRGILEKIQAPVNKAIDWVVGKAVAFGKKALALGKKALSKAKALGKKVVGGIKKKLGIEEKTPQERERAAVEAGVRLANKYRGRPIARDALAMKLDRLKGRYSVGVVEPVADGSSWSVRAVAQLMSSDHSQAQVPTAEADESRVGLPQIKAAVGRLKIIPFLQECVKSTIVEGMPVSKIREVYESQQGVRDLLHDAFRDAAKYNHEWIPTDMIFEVVDRAMTSHEDWLALQHELRTNTYAVIWRIEGKHFRAHAGTGRNLVVEHAAALKRVIDAQKLIGTEAKKEQEDAERKLDQIKAEMGPNAPTTQQLIVTPKGSKKFHDGLRDIFRKNKTIALFRAALQDYVRAEVWDGQHPGSLSNVRLGDVGVAVYTDNMKANPNILVGDLAKIQSTNKEKMLAQIASAGK